MLQYMYLNSYYVVGKRVLFLLLSSNTIDSVYSNVYMKSLLAKWLEQASIAVT